MKGENECCDFYSIIKNQTVVCLTKTFPLWSLRLFAPRILHENT